MIFAAEENLHYRGSRGATTDCFVYDDQLDKPNESTVETVLGGEHWTEIAAVDCQLDPVFAGRLRNENRSFLQTLHSPILHISHVTD